MVSSSEVTASPILAEYCQTTACNVSLSRAGPRLFLGLISLNTGVLSMNPTGIVTFKHVILNPSLRSRVNSVKDLLLSCRENRSFALLRMTCLKVTIPAGFMERRVDVGYDGMEHQKDGGNGRINAPVRRRRRSIQSAWRPIDRFLFPACFPWSILIATST